MIECIKNKSDKFGTLEQDFGPNEYSGKRVRLTAWLKGLDAGRVMIFLRVDGPAGEVLAFDNTHNRSARGTFDWLTQQIVIDVPRTGEVLQTGLLFQGSGRAWMDNVSLEVVDKHVKTTTSFHARGPPNPRRAGMFLDRPALNLDFERQRSLASEAHFRASEHAATQANLLLDPPSHSS